MSAQDERSWPPELTLAGVTIDVDNISDETGVIWLFDASGRHLAEIRNVARIMIGCTAPSGCASA